MLKKALLGFCLLTCSAISYAEHCPGVTAMKNGVFSGWKPLNINSASPLSTQEIEEFKHKVANFSLAEWMPSAPEGAAHCYYLGSEGDPLYLNVYLVKTNLKPAKSASWITMGGNIQQCRLNDAACDFTPDL